MNLNLKQLNESNATVQGSEFAIEDCETGRVFLTNKKYIDKLFKEMGYKNLNVIQVLEEYAGKVITNIGSLSTSKIYIDEDSDSFVVVSEEVLKKVMELFKFFKENDYEIVSERKYDDFYYWDQYVIKSPTGTYFALYLDLCDEYIHVLSLAFNDVDEEYKKLVGLIDEGKYKIGDDDFISSLTILMSNPIDASAGIDDTQKLSLREYVELLSLLGYVHKKKKNYCLTEEGENAPNSLEEIEPRLDDFNIMSWLQRHITDSGITFEKAYDMISSHLFELTYWQVKDFYTMNSCETSDMFVLHS